MWTGAIINNFLQKYTWNGNAKLTDVHTVNVSSGVGYGEKSSLTKKQIIIVNEKVNKADHSKDWNFVPLIHPYKILSKWHANSYCNILLMQNTIFTFWNVLWDKSNNKLTTAWLYITIATLWKIQYTLSQWSVCAK